MIAHRFGPSAALLGIIGLAWQALASLAPSVASPAVTAATLAALLQQRAFWSDAAATLGAFALSALLSVVGGLLTAAVLGAGRLATAVFQPILLNLYALPKVMLYPLVLLVFGLGLRAQVAFGVMHGLIPLALFTMGAMAGIRPVLLRTARVMRLSRLQTLWFVVLPAILPEVLAGLRLAVSLSLLGVLIGEMFASSSGLGHRVIVAMGRGDMAAVLAVAVLLAGFATVINTALLTLSR